MQEELNTRLLQKISYLEKGAVLGMIVCSCFFLAAILYFVKWNDRRSQGTGTGSS